MAKKDKEKEIVIINKFKEENAIDVRKSLEKAFKVYYELQVANNRI